VSRTPGNLDLFVIGFDNKVWTTFWPNAQGQWNADWFPLPGQAVFDHEKQQIAAVSRAPGNLDLFVIGFDNKVWTTFWAAREPFTCAFCNDGTCQCGSRTDEELCASHSGVDPELGCIQQE
jgi:hypothetical protein